MQVGGCCALFVPSVHERYGRVLHPSDLECRCFRVEAVHRRPILAHHTIQTSRHSSSKSDLSNHAHITSDISPARMPKNTSPGTPNLSVAKTAITQVQYSGTRNPSKLIVVSPRHRSTLVRNPPEEPSPSSSPTICPSTRRTMAWSEAAGKQRKCKAKTQPGGHVFRVKGGWVCRVAPRNHGTSDWQSKATSLGTTPPHLSHAEGR